MSQDKTETRTRDTVGSWVFLEKHKDKLIGNADTHNKISNLRLLATNLRWPLLRYIMLVRFMSFWINFELAYCFFTVYTPEQLAEKYRDITFLLYCLILVLVVALDHSVYRRGELLLAVPNQDLRPYCSNLLRLSLSSGYQLHSWFTHFMLLLFLSTAGFWMARLNEGLSFFDAIVIVPMFQIAWTFFSICTGFVYFQEYRVTTRSSHFRDFDFPRERRVFDALRTTMFVLGLISVFIGISLLAPDDSKGGDAKDTLLVSVSSSLSTDVDRLVMPSEDSQIKDTNSFVRVMKVKLANVIVKAKVLLIHHVALLYRSDKLLYRLLVHYHWDWQKTRLMRLQCL